MSSEAYHAVPAGWNPQEVSILYSQLGGVAVGFRYVLEAGRKKSARYPSFLYEFADLAAQDDAAAIAIFLRYLELNHFGFETGYVRERIVARLQGADFDDAQYRRLSSHFLSVLCEGRRRKLVWGYWKYWRGFIHWRDKLELEQLAKSNVYVRKVLDYTSEARNAD